MSSQNPTTNEVVDHIIEPTIITGMENQNYFGTIHHSGFRDDDEKQKYVQYAYSLGGIEFVKLIECENGNWNPFIQSATNDYGICQLNYRYNKKFIESEEYKDVYKQLDYCYNKFKYNPNLWYGPTRKIKGQLCKDYVSDRFTILE